MPTATGELTTKTMLLNMGPQHPATHGTLHLKLELDGERVVACTPEIGYLHTGFEKLGEYLTYNQFVVVTDRMNYMSPLSNNIGYSIAVEEMMGVEIPPRGQVLRVILAELSRIADHVLCCGLQGMDLGAFSVMLWAFVERERLYDVFEWVTGARLTTSYTRVGGLVRDVPPEFVERVRAVSKKCGEVTDEIERMLADNPIFRQRTVGIGAFTSEQCIAWGLTGPLARSSGVGRDVRRDRPYSGYEAYDFDVVTRSEGDCWGRFMQRLEEMRQSLRIIRQALDRGLPPGPVMAITKKVSLPDKESVWGSIEGLIHHFKQIMPGRGHGVHPGPGEHYSCTEAPNGELGFYLVSDGGSGPYRVRVRPPSLYALQAFPEMLKGRMLSDVVAVLSSLNVVAGELDR